MLSRLPRCRAEWILAIFAICLFPSCTFASPLQTVVYTSIPGVSRNQLSVDLYPCPKSAQALVVYVHGGAWIEGDKANVYAMPDYFAKHNVCFASVNYPLQSPSGKPLMDLQMAALSRLDDWLQSQDQQLARPRAYRNISIIGHSAGAHLVALLDKWRGWNHNVRNLVLMDSGAYDIRAKFNQSSLQYQSLMSRLLRLDHHSPSDYDLIFKRYSPALLPPKSRSMAPLNIFLLAGRNPISLDSATSLRNSYSLSPGHQAVIYNLPWQHADFPRKIGTDPVFSQKLLMRVQTLAR